MRGANLISEFIEYTSGGEVPVVFNRWAMITGISSLLERNLFYPFGFSTLYPNMYVMLMGVSGTKKSTPIKLVKKLMKQAGYDTFAADRTSKEKFLADLAVQSKKGLSTDDILEQNLFGSGSSLDASGSTPCLIAADEANDFFGINNIEFLSLLGSLWDYEGVYENKVKGGDSDYIPNPTINILSGNTPTNFSIAFPSTILGQGFFSRILLIHGQPNGKRIPRPPIPDPAVTASLVEKLRLVRTKCQGELRFAADADAIIDAIYTNYIPPEDPRFASYANRRHVHLLKLIMAVAGSHLTTFVTSDMVIEANSYLSFAEQMMPKALGSFGGARDAETVDKVMTFIRNCDGPAKPNDVFMHIHRDITKPSEYQDIIQKLLKAQQIEVVAGAGIIPVRKTFAELTHHEKFVDYDKYLSSEERGMAA